MWGLLPIAPVACRLAIPAIALWKDTPVGSPRQRTDSCHWSWPRLTLAYPLAKRLAPRQTRGIVRPTPAGGSLSGLGGVCVVISQKPARRAGFDLRLNRKLSWPIKLIWPVQPCLKKYSDFPKTQITFITIPILSHRGAARDRHGRGTGCGGRGWRLRRGRLMRTAKSCGSDASTLASSS